MTHYQTPKAIQNTEHHIARTIRIVLADWRAGACSAVETVAYLRGAGLFEAEIMETMDTGDAMA